jgi:hypothetical protein
MKLQRLVLGRANGSSVHAQDAPRNVGTYGKERRRARQSGVLASDADGNKWLYEILPAAASAANLQQTLSLRLRWKLAGRSPAIVRVL